MSTAKTEEERIVRTVCNSHCGGVCEMKVHVKGGKITRIENGSEGDMSHRMCARGRAYRQRVYAPDRVLYPLKRTGPRGSGQFTRVSWDEALDIVAGELKRVKATFGNASILHFCSLCDMNTVHTTQTFHRLLCQFGGYTAPWGTISNEGVYFASGATFGTRASWPTREELSKARLIIMWGWNPAVTHSGSGLLLHLIRAKAGGGKFISVDPRYTHSTAVFADQWIPIRPGTDAAVLVAMAHVIINENLHDQHFIDTHTFGFDRFRDYVFGLEDGVEKTPEWAEAISGIRAATIVQLARLYVGSKPAYIYSANSAGRTAFGEQCHRAIYVLEAITGNARVRSEGGPETRILARIAQIPSPPNPVEKDVPPRLNALPFRGKSVNSSARINVNMLADALLNGKAGGYPTDYKFLWLSNNNYLNQLADINKAIDAFQKPDFILVTEQFMTSTAKFADIVLPVCTFLERNDFYAGFSAGSFNMESGVFAVQNKAIEPLGESKSQLEICEALASKLGIVDYNDKSDESWVRQIVGKFTEELASPDYETLKEQGMFKMGSHEAAPSSQKEADGSEQNPFPTPSGRIEIYSQLIAEMKYPLIPPVPKYIETWESVNDPLAEKYPLQLITPHFQLRAHSQFANLPWLKDLRHQAVAISTIDAGARGIRDGDMVMIFNDRGKVVIPAEVTERMMPGVVAVPQGAWYQPDENGVDHGGCANVLTKNVTSPAGAFPSHTALVQVVKVER